VAGSWQVFDECNMYMLLVYILLDACEVFTSLQSRCRDTHIQHLLRRERERFSSNDGLFPWEDDEQLILYFSAIVFLAFGGKSTLEKMPFSCFI
jgi:hypothetical protein